MEISRQKKAFNRKLYLAYLIDHAQQSIRSLMTETGMPRRTLQDSIADFGDIGIDCEFVQHGVRNNDGYYQIKSWGPIDRGWIFDNIDHIRELLN